jgi:predicted acetyltransferase
VPWSTYLKTLEEQRVGVGLPADLVPATFLVADVEGEIVGRSSIRHALNDFLKREGGHIGYGVLPGHRRRGYATEILRQSLIIARANGVDRVLMICDDDNTGSRTVIEKCGAWLESDHRRVRFSRTTTKIRALGAVPGVSLGSDLGPVL